MSFGSGGFGGFGQQNTTGGFGGFGSNTNTNTGTGGFGTNTSTFGATQNTGTGLFGNTNTGGGFGSSTGGFGSTGTGAFGARPAFGATTSSAGGLFGSTTATAGGTGFGSAGGFGTNTNASTSSPFGGGGTSLFGGASKPAFGTSASTGGLFGSTANNTTTGFGSTAGGFGATTNPGIGTNVGDPPGTAAVPFQPYLEKENATNQSNSFQSILFMDAYKKWSSEELRLADYNQGRRYGNATGTGAFGVGSGFGGFGANNTTTPAAATTGGLFGSTGTATGGFGAQNTTGTGGFGSTNTGGGLFGTKSATTGNLFGAATSQPAQTGGLFGGTTGGGFGTTNTTGGFGSTPAAPAGSLFGSTATQNKPATGFGFGSGAATTSGFGSGTTAFGSTPSASTGGGLFGTTPANTGAPTGGGLFGTAQAGNAGTAGFGSSTGGFGTQQNQAGGGLFGQAKPATGGLFGTATNTTTGTTGTGTTGGGLFGSAPASTPFGAATGAQQTGGLFGTKPATATGGGLFGGSLGQATTSTPSGGGLFGGLGQNTQNQQQQQQAGSLFGGAMNQNQQKPSLFGSSTPATGGGLFGAQTNTPQQTGGLFGQSTNNNQAQAGGLGGSLFGNSQQGGAGLGASQGLTTSINDTGAYGAPSLFQSLAAQEIQNPGPLATPLSVNKSKTSRRSSILPLYKMNPGSASKFATPQKRGYGFSYSAFGTPSSVSSTASTPGTMSQSLLVGSVGRGLTKSISSSNLRRTYNPEDSILLPGAFSANSGPRFYGSTGSSKKLVINRDMRSDLFSTPSKVRDDTASSDNLGRDAGSSRKLTKRVSFDTTIAKDTVPEGGNGGASAGGGGEPDMGYLRPQTRSATNGAASSGNGALVVSPAASGEPEMEQITGKELAIVHEEESSPERPRCIPDNYQVDSKELGEYWMSPSKEAIERMNRVQRQQVVNFTVGRTNVGQVRFRVPVDLTKISLDSILGGIVTLSIRSATVYPDVNSKPPMGQGLNVPAEILLLHTYPRSGPDAGASKIKRHIAKLKSIPDTTFVSYDEKTAAWVFRVEHFTTYGLDDDDEDDETDAEITNASAVAATPTPTNKNSGRASVYYPAVVPSTEQPDDDTFEFRRHKHYVSVPGAFDSSHDIMEDDEDDEEQPSFLSERSAEKSSLADMPIATTEHDDDMELGENSGQFGNEGEAPFSRQLGSAAELDISNSLEEPLTYPSLPPAVQETPGGVMRARLRAIKESNTPIKLQVADGDNWMDMLQKTVSPQKRDRAALKALGEQGALEKAVQETAAQDNKRQLAASRGRNALDNNRGFATSIDLMNSLFDKVKAPATQAPKSIVPATGFVKWSYKKPSNAVDEDESNMDATERAFHDTVKPKWSADGALIVPEAQGHSDDTALKRIRILDPVSAALKDDPLENILEHKDAVDVHVVDGVPSIATSRLPPIKTFAAFCGQANRSRSANASTLAQDLGAYERSVWDLASVLFDPVDELAASAPAEVARQRRENLAKFWARLVQEGSSTKALDQARSLEEKAVLHLASRKVPEACRALVDSKNLNAAALVALIGTSDAFKKDMREQVDDWHQGDVLAEFAVPLRAVYSLLAGNVAVCEGKKGGGVENRMDSIVLSEQFGLDWKQAFGLRLWYGIAAGAGIEAAVAQYVEDLEQGRVPAPRPWYADRRDVPGAGDVQAQAQAQAQGEREDLLFGLLKVAAGLERLEDVLAPENAQPSPFRYRFCWQLHQALCAVPGLPSSAKLSTGKADALTTSYASEVLSHSGDGSTASSAWVHAIWVLLHLSDGTARTHAVQEVLAQHIGTVFRDKGAQAGLYDSLVDELRVPAQWVWQAAALYWRNQANQAVLEAECLLRASAYSEAHRLFVKELAPKAVVEHNYGAIAEMLDKLRPHRQQIRAWPLGGEVYSRFLDLLALQRGEVLRGSGGGGSGGSSGSGSSGRAATRSRSRQQQQARDEEAEQASGQLIGVVEALGGSLPAMYDSAGSDALPAEVAAITEMADAVAQETMALANKGRMDLTKISRLPLTEDRRVRYSTDLAFAYYREVMSAH